MLWLKDSLDTPPLFSEADLAVAMKKATFLLCLSTLWSQDIGIPAQASPAQTVPDASSTARLLWAPLGPPLCKTTAGNLLCLRVLLPLLKEDKYI